MISNKRRRGLMSVRDYEKAIDLIKRNKEFLTCIGGCSDELIKKAEKRLNVSFPQKLQRLFV